MRDQIERQPSQFLSRELAGTRFATSVGKPPLLRTAADEVAQFLGARGSDLVFVDNATHGVNAVLRSMDFKESDEILILDQAYGAIRNALEYTARRHGAVVRPVEIRLPLPSADAVIEKIEEGIGGKTRLAILDQVTSESALILPLAQIASRCRVAVLVDGARTRRARFRWIFGLDQGIAAEFDCREPAILRRTSLLRPESSSCVSWVWRRSSAITMSSHITPAPPWLRIHLLRSLVQKK